MADQTRLKNWQHTIMNEHLFHSSKSRHADGSYQHCRWPLSVIFPKQNVLQSTKSARKWANDQSYTKYEKFVIHRLYSRNSQPPPPPLFPPPHSLHLVFTLWFLYVNARRLLGMDLKQKECTTHEWHKKEIHRVKILGVFKFPPGLSKLAAQAREFSVFDSGFCSDQREISARPMLDFPWPWSKYHQINVTTELSRLDFILGWLRRDSCITKM